MLRAHSFALILFYAYPFLLYQFPFSHAFVRVGLVLYTLRHFALSPHLHVYQPAHCRAYTTRKDSSSLHVLLDAWFSISRMFWHTFVHMRLFFSSPRLRYTTWAHYGLLLLHVVHQHASPYLEPTYPSLSSGYGVPFVSCFFIPSLSCFLALSMEFR